MRMRAAPAGLAMRNSRSRKFGDIFQEHVNIWKRSNPYSSGKASVVFLLWTDVCHEPHRSRENSSRIRVSSQSEVLMSNIVQALETAAAILLSVVVLTSIIAAVAVKRGEVALSKDRH